VARAGQRGLSLIELMITIAVFGITLGLAVPSYQVWIQNTQIRNAADSIKNGLQIARNEALRRNQTVEFILTGDNPTVANVDTINPGNAGPNWMVRVFQTTGNNQAQDYIQGRPAAESSVNAVFSTAAAGNQDTIQFSPLGRANFFVGTAPTPSTLASGDLWLDVSNSAGTCKSNGGALRCLRIVVSPGGRLRSCDPNLAAGSSPLAC
jgi:type IV fimbrial biogenesis protein FimT